MFHRLEVDLEAEQYGGLAAPRFFQLAERLPAYQGAIAARAAQEQDQTKTHTTPAETEHIGSDATTLQTHPALDGLVEVVRVPAQ